VSELLDLDPPHAPRGEAFSDALTIAFGDPDSGAYGTVRLGVAGGTIASGLVVLFRGGEVVTVTAEGGESADVGSWDDVSAAGIDVETLEPLRRWRLAFADADAALDLDLEALGSPCALDPADPVAKAGGMLGFEQPLRVTGTLVAGGDRLRLDGLGQRGRSWGSPDWDRIGRARTVSAWFGDRAVTLAAIAHAGGGDHGAEAIGATVFGTAADGCERIGDPRLSTTFDAGLRWRRSGLAGQVPEPSRL
jgi:hypothetical protein